jgi:predicted XRE-type DNA-binding protein
MADSNWRTWDEIEAEAKAAGRLDESRVRAHQKRMRAEQRAYRLAEIRRERGFTQTEVAAEMNVTQKRVSAVEHGLLDHFELRTIVSYVQAIGGRVEVVADFGDERVVVGDPESMPAVAGLAAAPRSGRRSGQH